MLPLFSQLSYEPKQLYYYNIFLRLVKYLFEKNEILKNRPGSSVCRQLVVLLPVAWLLAQTGRLDLVWTAFIIAEIVSATLSGIFLRRTFRSAKALLNI